MNKHFLQAISTLTLVVIFLLAGCSAGVPMAVTASTGDNSAAQSVQEPVAEPKAEPAGDQAADTAEASPTAAEASLQSWKTIIDTQISFNTNIEGFLNEQYGISVGVSGEIHYSADGGKTWPKAENTSMCRFSLDIVDENLSWCGGNGNGVRVSRDGGKTWTAVTDANLGGGHSNIDFVDDTTGWITTLSKCAFTKDGGTTWTELTLPEDLKGIAATCLRTPLDGYILTHDGLLFTTADGGATWSKKDLEIKNYEVYDLKNNPGLNRINLALADISFTDKDNGIIVFTGMEPGKGYKTWCLTTSNGGADWTSELIPAIEGFSPVKVFLSGDGQYLTLGSLSKRMIVMKR